MSEAKNQRSTKGLFSIILRRRKEINPHAKELEWTDQDLMIALGAAIETKDELKPTVAGIILFGSEIALRRLFPIAARVDYLIIDGKE